jgi:signal transduction histidine kinase
MVKAHQTLKRFDRYLSELQSRLVRTRVDEGLLRQVVDEIGGEYTLSRIRLEALDVDPVPSSVHVEVARNDLILILKNILRNAILAVSKKEQSRVVRMTVKVELEATGDESVHLLVADSADESLDQEKLRHHGVASGLGLVVTAVHRYGGTVAVRPAGGPFKKAVDIRFFRAFEDNQNNGSDR